MGRVPVECKKCGTYLSGKNRDDPVQMCNVCKGVGYSPSPNPKSGRKYIFKKSK